MNRLTEKEVARRWGVSTRTLQLWRQKEIGPRFLRLGERSILYRESDVLDYERLSIVGKPIAPEGWEMVVKRSAGALALLSKNAKSAKAKETLAKLGAELRSLITKSNGEAE